MVVFNVHPFIYSADFQFYGHLYLRIGIYLHASTNILVKLYYYQNRVLKKHKIIEIRGNVICPVTVFSFSFIKLKFVTTIHGVLVIRK